MYVIHIAYIISSILTIAGTQNEEIFLNILGGVETPLKIIPYRNSNSNNLYSYYMGVKNFPVTADNVRIDLFYECHCPDCVQFDTTQFKDVVEKLAHRLNIYTYPYGNARTIEQNGKIMFQCQHGPKECYGNKLHACALKHIGNYTEALLFNSCMMKQEDGSLGSDDPTARKCGRKMGINVAPILQCAKSMEGTQLLKYYGQESKKANFKYVPYVLINGVTWTGDDFMGDVCAAFKNAPEPCAA